MGKNHIFIDVGIIPAYYLNNLKNMDIKMKVFLLKILNSIIYMSFLTLIISMDHNLKFSEADAKSNNRGGDRGESRGGSRGGDRGESRDNAQNENRDRDRSRNREANLGNNLIDNRFSGRNPRISTFTRNNLRNINQSIFQPLNITQQRNIGVGSFIERFNQNSEILNVRNNTISQVIAGFQNLDIDGNGILSQSELEAGEINAISAASSVINNPIYNGNLTVEEVQQNISSGFERLDLDGNGTVTVNELNSSQGVVVQVVTNLFPDQIEDSQLTRSELETSINTRFSRFDLNTDGILSIDELNELNKGTTDNIVENLMTRYDQNSNGQINSGEAFNLVNRLTSNGIDVNEDGSISSEELNTHLIDQKSNTQMAFLDQDRDGNINLNEYSQREVSNFNRFDTDQDGTITTEQ